MIHRNRIASIIAVVGTLAARAAAAHTVIVTDRPIAGALRSITAQTTPSATAVTIYQDAYIDDPVDLASATESASTPASNSPAKLQLVSSAPTPATPSPPPSPHLETASDTSDASDSVVSTTAPARTPPSAVPTTTAFTATTTWASGIELPSDWPANKPYPPIPAGCTQPHLEDDGVWNCEH